MVRATWWRVRAWLSRLSDIVRRGARERALAEDIETHLSLLTDEFVARGLSEVDARLAARRAFGGVDRIKALHRDQRGLPLLDAAIQDMRFAVRLLRRDRSFTVVSTLVLGLGIGVTHMFLTIVYAHTMRGLPVPDPDRLLSISAIDDRGTDRPLTRLELEAIQALGAFASVVGYTSAAVTIGDEGRAPDRFEASFVGADAFATVRARPMLGRDFTTADHRAGAERVILLGRSAWRSRYAGDATILGRQVLVNGTPTTVVGIVPDAAGFPSTAAAWLPLVQWPGYEAAPATQRQLRVVARLADGVTESDARRAVESAVARADTGLVEGAARMRARVMPINERLLLRIEGPWLAFLLAGCVIVLIACANTGNLMLARGFRRAREVAVRSSLGASRGRLVRQVLTESLILAAAGGIAGLAVSSAGIRIFGAGIPAGTLPYWLDYRIDAWMLLVLLIVSTASAVLFGIVPALIGSRIDVHAVLRDGGRALTAARTARPWMTAFLGLEIALSVVLLASITIGGLALRSTVWADAVVRTEDVVAATVTLPATPYGSPDSRARFLERLVDRVGARSIVSGASLTTFLPLTGASERHVRLETDASDTEAAAVATVEVGPAYFRTLGLRTLRGREFSRDDAVARESVALVNERFASRFARGAEIVGTRVAVFPAGSPAAAPSWLTIVGVVPDLRQRTRAADAEPVVYLPVTTAPPATTMIVVRSTGTPETVADLLRADALALDAAVPLYRIQTLARAIHDADWNPRLSARLANSLTFLCLLLATVGLYSVTAHAVWQRRHEFGIRLALGATPARVVRLVLSGVKVPLSLGLGLGCAGALAWSRAFPSGQPGLSVTNPLVLAVVLAVLALITIVACVVPARRAAGLDPVASLREDCA